MMNGSVMALLWFGAIGCGMMAGIYFAFSTFIMASLSKIAPPAGIAAMQSINDVILRSPFMPLFFGTSLVAAGVVVMAVRDQAIPGGVWLLSAGAVYFVGMFLCTVFFNVPLNNKLKAVDPAAAASVEVWAHYLRVWTVWNHLRTVASAAASILFFVAIIARQA